MRTVGKTEETRSRHESVGRRLWIRASALPACSGRGGLKQILSQGAEAVEGETACTELNTVLHGAEVNDFRSINASQSEL